MTSIVRIQTGSTVALQTQIDTLIECLLEAGIIVEGEPPTTLTSDNGISSANIHCTGDPMCAKIEQQ